jgi:Flp pilus assembly protein TadD
LTREQLRAGDCSAGFAAARLGPAQTAFERAVELDPTDAHARFGLGRTLERQSRHQDAFTQYHIAFTLSPDPDYDAARQRVEARLDAVRSRR